MYRIIQGRAKMKRPTDVDVTSGFFSNRTKNIYLKAQLLFSITFFLAGGREGGRWGLIPRLKNNSNNRKITKRLIKISWM